MTCLVHKQLITYVGWTNKLQSIKSCDHKNSVYIIIKYCEQNLNSVTLKIRAKKVTIHEMRKLYSTKFMKLNKIKKGKMGFGHHWERYFHKSIICVGY